MQTGQKIVIRWMTALTTVVALIILPVSFVVVLLSASQTQAQDDSCATCHLAIGIEKQTKPAQDFKNDIHGEKGFGCASCHGGDPSIMGLESMDPKKGYIGRPQGKQIVAMCGRCHTDDQFMRQHGSQLPTNQVAEYFKSAHGKRLASSNDAKVATCASCHRPHGIRPSRDATSSVHPLRIAATCGSCHADAKYMADYKIPTDQHEKYLKSVHWNAIAKKGDLSAPICNDCHGSHGAAPAGLSSAVQSCSQCHPVNSDLYNKSSHAQIFTQMGVAGCKACHGPHDVMPASEVMLGKGSGAICTSCHTQGSAGEKVATAMHDVIVTLNDNYTKAKQILDDAEHAGMEVSQAQFELANAKTALLKARSAIHSFNPDLVEKEAAPGLKIALTAYQKGIDAFAELQFRRKGLAVSSLIILALVIGLIIKIRDIDGNF